MKTFASLLLGLGILTAWAADAAPKATPVSTGKASVAKASSAISADNMLSNSDFGTGDLTGWTVENTKPAASTSEVIIGGGSIAGTNALKVAVTAVVPTSQYGWEVQVFHTVAIDSGKTYLVTFSGKAEPAINIPVVCMQNKAPWGHHTYETTANLSSKWQNFEFRFKAIESDSLMRINFGNLATAVGQTITLSNVLMKIEK
jgi:hypothetical protein